MKQEILRMERVTQIEKGVTMLEDFNLNIFQGEIMGLIPIDTHGLGKLLSLLQFNEPIYDGYVYYGNQMINSWKVSRKGANRIGLISDKTSLVERLNVVDNIFVLRNGFKQEIIREQLLRKQLIPFLQEIGVELDLDVCVEKLSAFHRIVVELIRTVIAGYKLIILNGINAVISEKELRKLYEILRHYAESGFTFLVISYHIEEITDFCDRVALMSGGHIQKVISGRELKAGTLQGYVVEFDKMVRKQLEERREPESPREVVFRLNGISGHLINKFSLEVYGGECLVIQVRDENMLQEVTRFLKGEIKPSEGDFSILKGSDAISGNQAVSVILSEPTESMIFPELTYMDNLCMGLSMRLSRIWRSAKLRSSIRQELGAELGTEVFDKHMDELTQKEKYQLVYTRVRLQKPKIVFCIQPFKSADLEHRMFVWKMMEKLLNRGIAVVIITVNLADSLSLAERLVRIGSDGKVVQIMRNEFGLLQMVPGFGDAAFLK